MSSTPSQTSTAMLSGSSSQTNGQTTPTGSPGVKVWVKRSKALSSFDVREAALKQQESVIRTSYENQATQVNRSEQELRARLAAVSEQRSLLTAHKAWEEQKRRLLLARSAAKERARREAEGFVDDEFKTPDPASISAFRDAPDQEDGVSTVVPSVAASSVSTPLRISRNGGGSASGRGKSTIAMDLDTDHDSQTCTGVSISDHAAAFSASSATIPATNSSVGAAPGHLGVCEEEPSVNADPASQSHAESLLVMPTVRQLVDTTHEAQLLELEMAAHQAEDPEADGDADNSDDEVKVTGLPLTPTDSGPTPAMAFTPGVASTPTQAGLSAAAKRPFAVWASIWFQLQLLMADNQTLMEDILLAVSPFERKLRFVQNVYADTHVEPKVRYEINFGDVLSFTELTSAPITANTTPAATNSDHSGKFALRLQNQPESKSLFIFRVPSQKERDAVLRFLQAGPLQNVFEVASFEFRYPDLTNESDPSLLSDSSNFGLDEPTTPVITPSGDASSQRRPSIRGRRPSVSTAMALASPRASLCAATNFSTWLRPRGHLDPNLWNERVPPFEALMDISPSPTATIRVIGVIHKWRLAIYSLDEARLASFERPDSDPALAPSDPAMDAWTSHERRLMYMARTSVPLLSLYMTALSEESEEDILSQIHPDSAFFQRITANDPPESLFDPNACVFFKYVYADSEPEMPGNAPKTSASTTYIRLRMLPMSGNTDSTEVSRLASQVAFYVQELSARGRARKISRILGTSDAKPAESGSRPSTPDVARPPHSSATSHDLRVTSTPRTYSPRNEVSTPTIESLGQSTERQVRPLSLK